MLFDDWHSLLRVAVVAPLSYAILLLAVRVSGKRTLAKMNAFDLVVTVALGSTLATVITSGKLALAEGALSLAVLVFLQFAIAWASRRSSVVAGAVKSSPQILFRDGDFAALALARERVLEDDVLQAVRSSGIVDLNDVEAVVLESDGSFSVLKKAAVTRRSSLSNVVGAWGHREKQADTPDE